MPRSRFTKKSFCLDAVVFLDILHLHVRTEFLAYIHVHMFRLDDKPCPDAGHHCSAVLCFDLLVSRICLDHVASNSNLVLDPQKASMSYFPDMTPFLSRTIRTLRKSEILTYHLQQN